MSGDDDARGAETHIAIIGMAGRFPGARSVDELWSNLRAGVESVEWLTDDALLAAGESPEALADPRYVKACPVLADVERYDAAFFGHSPRDASIMDPQHRIFLETAWAALENAGYLGDTHAGPIGVFAAAGMNAYMMHHLVPNREVMETVGEWLVRHTANDMNFLATRVSYELDLRGPSMNVQTACSSALVAVHVAVQSLLSGECDLALAGGSAISLPHDRGYLCHEGEILSPDGHCRAFDAGAAGTLFGSGAGCVVLKRLADALADGDHVLAVLRGSAINNDGSAKVGYLAPSVDGQARVVAEALAVAGVSAESISYVETHGTGTRIGDPIEVAALTRAFRASTSRTGFCAIGSMKPNIGHLGEAAGVAGLIKTVLALGHGELPPSINYERANPEIDFASTPFFVNASLAPWKTGAEPRRAGVSALGAGGTNVHVIVEEAPPTTPRVETSAPSLLVLSAKTATALDTMTSNLGLHLSLHPEQPLADVAGTLQLGRRGFAHRRAVVCRDRDDAVAALSGVDPSRVLSGVRGRAAPTVVFMFPGGGAQYPRMGIDLYEAEPAYRDVIEQCCRLLRAGSGLDLRAALFPPVADVARRSTELDRPSLALPALFATSLATAKVLQSWGVEPAAMIGHSAGEYVAACLAGVLSVEDALGFAALRGRLFETLAPGAMLSVALGADQARAHLGADLSIAADNAPDLCVVSGPKDAIESLEATLMGEGIAHARLHLDVAAHSAMLEPILAEVERHCRTVRFSAPARPYVSNVTGTWITEHDVVDPRYWSRHLRGTVRFSEGLAVLLDKPSVVLVEVGPGRTLAALARQQPAKSLATVSTLRHPKEAGDDRAHLLDAVGKLWVVGVDVAWRALQGEVRVHRVPLPTYPFEGKRFWIDRGAAMLPSATPAAVLSRCVDVADWFHLPSWRRSLAPSSASGDAGPPTYLIFAGDTALAKKLALLLPSKAWITVVPGKAFARTGEHAYEIAEGVRADYDALIDDLASRGLLPQRIVHLWTVTPDPSVWARMTKRRAADSAEFAVGQARGFYSLLFLAQALAARSEPFEITVVSNHLQQLAGETSLDADKATLLGPCLVIPREFPNVMTRSVDVVLPKPGSRQEDVLCAQLAAEIASTPTDSICAYRGDDRWVRRFERVRLEPTTSTSVRAGGVYLITGGLGGLGLELAVHLAKAARIKLVLVGREPMPARATWAALLATRSASDATCRKIRRLQEIDALGSEVMTASADVTDLGQMERVIADATTRFGPIRGVVHAAGQLDDALIATRPSEAKSDVLAVKVQGARVLDLALRGTPLDFFVLFSSVSGLLGLPGQVDYTAANAFLDAFARQLATRDGTRVVAIDWSAWRDVGMAAAPRDVTASPKLDWRVGPSAWLERKADDGDNVVFSTDVARERQWLVDEHVVRGGDALIPGTGYLEIARAALCDSAEARAIELRDVVFAAPFVVPRGVTRELRLRLSRKSHDFVFHGGSDPTALVTGRIAYVDAEPAATADLTATAARCAVTDEPVDGFLDQSFMSFGPRWGNVRRIRRGRGEALVTLELPAALTDDLALHPLHPALLDMATGGAQALIPGFDRERDFYAPFSYGRVLVRGALEARIHAHVTLHDGHTNASAVFDVTISNDAGTELVEIRDFVMRRVDPRALASNAAPTSGPGARQPSPGSLRELALREGITTAEGLSAFDRILACRGVSQIVASSIDLDGWSHAVAAAARPAHARDTTTDTSDAVERSASGPPYVAPRNELERELVGFWRELLGVAQVGVHDDFFELGGQSLVAVRLFNKIRKRYGVDLPLSTLFEAPTISRCADVLRLELGIVTPEPVAADRAPVPHASRWSSLVAMQPLGARAPFYCVAGMGGNLANLRRLALLVGPEQPFFGLQPPGLDGKQKRLYRVEELALHYLEQILAYQPVGPFSVGGYSGGGVAAYELSRQLAERGHAVAFLGLLDSFSPSLPRRSALARVGIHARRTATLGPSYLVDATTRRLDYERREATRLTTRWLGKVFPERYRYANIGDAWMIAAHAYHPGTYDGAATLFRAAEETALTLSTAYDVDEQHGWGRFVLGGVGVERCPGNHASMCEEPHVHALAAKLRDALSRVPRASAVA